LKPSRDRNGGCLLCAQSNEHSACLLSTLANSCANLVDKAPAITPRTAAALSVCAVVASSHPSQRLHLHPLPCCCPAICTCSGYATSLLTCIISDTASGRLHRHLRRALLPQQNHKALTHTLERCAVRHSSAHSCRHLCLYGHHGHRDLCHCAVQPCDSPRNVAPTRLLAH
jgi:hypothetical protein